MKNKLFIFRYFLEKNRTRCCDCFDSFCFLLHDKCEQTLYFLFQFIKILTKIMNVFFVTSVIFFVRCIYRTAVLPWLQGDCRFHPTCSQYCIQAFEQHPFWRALFLVLSRMARCHPWGPCGHDPVPPSLFPSS